jgi:hypothetical protein
MKSLGLKQGKIHNIWHPIKKGTYHIKKQESTVYEEEKNQ